VQSISALRKHWPEYLMEAWGLGMFMVTAGLITALLEYPGSLAHQWLPNADLRRGLIAVAMGLTAIGIIYSPWGRQSGAHINPAITLAFLCMGKVKRWDALYYMIAQFVGGSGAGGAAVAYSLVRAGKRVLMLEKGEYLPADGSTLDVGKVFAEGQFKNRQAWLDGQGKQFVPEEYYNVGGKTKWYGAALLRFSPHEFEADHAFGCLPWPIPYSELEPWYQQAEQLLRVTHFDFEADLATLIDQALPAVSGWRIEQLPLGLSREILQHPNEARHFDGFASATGQKSEASRCI